MRYDAAVIGAGVVGAAIARELSRYELNVIVLEKENDVSTGSSKANSGIVHAGYDPEEGTLMAKLNVQANTMFESLCDELSVPYKKNSSLVVAFDDEQMGHIERLRRRGVNNGVPGLSIISADELIRREPSINPAAKGALLAETAGIVDPMLLTISLMENAVMNGADYLLEFETNSVERIDGGYRVSANGRAVEAAYVVNAAGVNSDRVHNLAAKPAFVIKPRRGQYYMLDKSEGKTVSATLFPCPSHMGKGILVAPTVHGNIILGPASDDVTDRYNVGTSDEILDKAAEGARLLVPKISTRNCIRTFSGMRAEPDTDDFIIREAEGAPGFVDAAGIKSPGLTAAPAIAKYVVSILSKAGLALKEKKSFNPVVARKPLIEMHEEGQSALIDENPLYGRIICRCENVTEGDIVDAISRRPGAVTLDGVKRRCRTGMGRCQGGFCGPRVQQILARELGRPLDGIVLEKKNSYILTGRSK